MREWKKCKRCKSEKIIKNGRQEGIQRYKCKDCKRVFRGKEGKYSDEFKMDAIKMYLNSMGIRAIARMKKVHNSVISSWIKKMGSVVKEEFTKKIEEVQSKDISIIEIDELFTYIKKKKIKHMYLLLSREIGSELLILK